MLTRAEKAKLLELIKMSEAAQYELGYADGVVGIGRREEQEKAERASAELRRLINEELS